MTVDQMRAAITDVYPGRKWQKKVEKMHDDQVIAVYHKFLGSGKFNEKPEKKVKRKTSDPIRETRKQQRKFEAYRGEQISIFDKL